VGVHRLTTAAHPPELNADALKEWRKISRQLFAAGMLTVVDGAVLAAYCQAHGRWRQCERALAELSKRGTGLLIRTTKGNFIQNPLVRMANHAMSDMVRYAIEFGMTPSSRSRVRANLNGQTDPTDDFFAS
jgi:P27 family predicted phage terminase small subunit